LHELATIRCRSAPPPIGFARLSECCRQRRCHAYWVSVNPLRCCPDARERAGSTLRSPHRCPLHTIKDRGHPLSGLDSLSEFHPCITAGFRTTRSAQSGTRPFRGFFPFSVLPATRSHLPRRDPSRPVRLRPRGFAPPRRFAPRATCRACFISVPPLGFTLRGFYPLRCRTPFRTPRPSWDWDPSEDGPSLQGLAHHKELITGPEFSRVAENHASLGSFPSEASCSPRMTDQKPVLPSRAFSARSRADLAAGASGFPTAVSASALSRDRRTPRRFCTSLTFSTLWALRGTGLLLPLTGGLASPQTLARSSFHHRLPGRSLPRTSYR
jgi:hypothetical protein